MSYQHTTHHVKSENDYRPTYHFLPSKNWMNDPNGPIYYNGYYHLFYQYNPNGSEWGDIHWGHARSHDLIHWEHLPIALSPSYDRGEHHCFSGCTVLDGTTPTIFYTSVGGDERNHVTGAEQWVATTKDDMITWDKPERNPILKPDIHGDLDIREWRDPFVWKEADYWYMVLGGQHEGKGCVLLYKSTDLNSWEFINILYKDTGDISVCECPNFFKLGEHYVLVFSPIHQDGHGEVIYITGTWNSDLTFTPLYRDTLDHSGIEGYYAPTSFVDEHGRRILLGWITEESRGNFLAHADWAGVQAIPRVLSLSNTHRLEMKPVDTIQQLRTHHVNYNNVTINRSDEWVPEAAGQALELIANIECAEKQGSFSIQLLQSPDKEEETELYIDPIRGTFDLIRQKSSLSNSTSKKTLSGRFDRSTTNHLKVHVLLDHSVIEIFINNTSCLATRVYPTLQTSNQISITNNDNSHHLKIDSLNIWNLASIW